MERLFDRRSFMLGIGSGLTLCIGLPVIEARADQPSAGEIFIGELEKRIIRSYYERHLIAYQQSPDWHDYKNNKGKKKHKGLPPGLAKKGTLPPGIAKQLARNGHLPPGLEYRSLPHDLIVELPTLQRGYNYVIVDDRVMLIKAASNIILDVLTVAALDLLD